MNCSKKFCWMMAVIFFAALNIVSAQTKEDLLAGTADVTWLGLDFSQAKFIGTATQFKDAGEVTNADFRDKFIRGWNQLFIDEQKKYDVAKVVHRPEIKYAIDVTGKSQQCFKERFFL